MKQQLTEEQKKIIHDLRVKSGEALRAGKSDESVSLSLQAWETLPEPKFNTAESYIIVTGLIFIYMQIRDYANAKKWSEILYSCNTDRYDDGDRDFTAGKIAFEMNDLDQARELFTLANQKSEGRCFQDEDKKYKAFFGEKNLRPTGFKALHKLSITEFKKGNFQYALSLAYDCLNIIQMDADVLLLKGKCHFELGEMDHAADSFTQAYMLEGEAIFERQDSKYVAFLKSKIKIEGEKKKKPWWKF